MKILHISAGGRSERIAAYISSIKPFMPKHLLPIPTEGKTILGEIIFNAHGDFGHMEVWASTETYPQISLALEKLVSVRVRVDAEMTGPLGPMLRAVLGTKTRTHGCAGDFYCHFSWEAFEKFHDSHGLPISILVANSISAPKGARFLLDGAKVSSWERVGRTNVTDKINIGCYIIDPDERVLEGIQRMKEHKEDEFFKSFVSQGLVGGYDPGVPGFNVNVSEVYTCLLTNLAQHR